MTFVSGSSIAVPLTPTYETSALGDTAKPDSNASGFDAAEHTPPVGSAIPAHLQLPTIDFSLKGFGDLPPAPHAATASPAAPASGGELPAHLQLPEFPTFELPPIPGEEGKAPSPVEMHGIEGGSFGADQAPQFPSLDDLSPAPMAQEPGATPEGESWVVPPPPPLPPPRRPSTPPPPPSQEQKMDLPTFARPAAKKQVTLVESSAAAALAEDNQKHRRPYLLILILVVLGAAGVGAVFKRNEIVAYLGQREPTNNAAVDQAKAMELFLDGAKDEKAEKYATAIDKFSQAVKLDAKLGRAHRELAIVFAKTKKEAEAVEQYEAYLDCDPEAPDASAVRKIVADYKAAQDKKPKADPKKNAKKKGKR
jgi:hypothetical protein